MRFSIRTVRFALLLAFVLLIGADLALAQDQTNDPFVDEQQYLFDVHNVGDAWSYTTGSSNVKLGVYSMTGFIQNHEDLSSSRVLAPQGGVVEPVFDFASEMVGIAGADTDNGVGMAGVDRAARLQSYSILLDDPRTTDPEKIQDREVPLEGPGGSSEVFYLDPIHYSEVVNEGRSNGVDVHLFSFGVPYGKISTFDFEDLPSYDDPEFMEYPGYKPEEDILREAAYGTIESALNNIFASICGVSIFGINITGDCSVPPDPQEAFRQAVGNAVKLDEGVVVAPSGDLSIEGENSNFYLPATLGKYSVTIGGIQRDSDGDLSGWNRSLGSPFVDVAGFAEEVVGLSASDPEQYNADFGGTAAAASIGAGVASLLKAENPNLTGEDVEEILKRTAYDVGDVGRDNATGKGAIDAGAALSFVSNNDVQREKVTVANVTSDETTIENVAMNGDGYDQYLNTYCGPDSRTYAKGDLHKFRARVEFEDTFSTPPDVWVRWSNSDGVDPTVAPESDWNDGKDAYYDDFVRGIRVISTDERGMTIEGYYWYAKWYRLQQYCTEGPLPKAPENFEIAYTAVGTEGAPPPLPLKASMSRIGQPSVGEPMTFTVSASDGPQGEPHTYLWERAYIPEENDPPSYGNFIPPGTDFTTLTERTKSSSTDSYSITVFGYPGDLFGYRATVERGSMTTSTLSTFIVFRDVGGGGGGGGDCTPFDPCECPPGELCIASLEEESPDGMQAQSSSVEAPNADSTGSSPPASLAADGQTAIELPDGRWAVAAANVPADSLRALVRQVEAGKLEVAAATSGGAGMAGAAAMEGQQPSRTLPTEFALQGTYPNPARQNVQVTFDLPEEAPVEAGLYDALGRQVQRREQSAMAPGRGRQVTFDVSNLSSGVYLFRLRAGEATATGKIVVVR